MRKKKRSEPEFVPEIYTEEQFDAVDKHINQYFGEYKNVLHEIVSPDIHVDVCMIEPNEERDYYTLVTMGMGAHKMNVPKELAGQGYDRAELAICLPSDWEPDNSDEIHYWPIRLLKKLARLPINEDSWIGWGHSIDNGEAFGENTEMCGTLILNSAFGEESCTCALPDGEEVNFYQLLPIYRDEMDFKLENGAEELLGMFESVNPIVDPHRESVVKYVGKPIMDTYQWHVYKVEDKNLPLDELTGYNHMAIYLRWTIEHDMMNEEFYKAFPDIADAVKSGENTDLREFIRDRLEGRLFRDDFNEEGEKFAAFYYNHGARDGAPCYPSDVDDHALEYFGEERYNSDEFQDEAYLFVPFDEEYYTDMCRYIEKNYEDFKNLAE